MLLHFRMSGSRTRRPIVTHHRGCMPRGTRRPVGSGKRIVSTRCPRTAMPLSAACARTRIVRHLLRPTMALRAMPSRSVRACHFMSRSALGAASTRRHYSTTREHSRPRGGRYRRGTVVEGSMQRAVGESRMLMMSLQRCRLKVVLTLGSQLMRAWTHMDST